MSDSKQALSNWSYTIFLEKNSLNYCTLDDLIDRQNITPKWPTVQGKGGALRAAGQEREKIAGITENYAV